MSLITEQLPWHAGEDTMHKILRVPYGDNPNTPFLTPQRAYMLQVSPLIALGTLDEKGRPWATLWGGEAGFSQQVAPSIIGIRTMIDSTYDPVAETLFGGRTDGEVVKAEGNGKMVSGLSIDLENRMRVKLFGRMIAGALGRNETDTETKADDGVAGQVQLVVKIEQSLGNCPKYLNRKHILPTIPEPKLLSDSKHLPQEAMDLISQADSFFIASSNHDIDMDCNIRGGPQGFVRVESNDESGAVLVWPEYSGNRLYQTLGNLQVSPRAGIVIPNFSTGDALYLTGETSIFTGEEAAAILPRSNITVRFVVTAARFVQHGLPFRAEPLDPSPYNPSVRYLPNERQDPTKLASQRSETAKLIAKTKITRTITRYRFALSSPPEKPWRPGQYVAMSFHDELDMGYSHMRDDDPRSLNDDYIRTFTISSAPGLGRHGEEFEITVRRVGSVTNWMNMLNERVGTELEIIGIGGEFEVQTDASDKLVPYIAGGIGITPLLPSLGKLDYTRLKLLWALNVVDIELARDTFKRNPGLSEVTTLFLSGSAPNGDEQNLRTGLDGARVERRRLTKPDFDHLEADKFYLCSGPKMRKDVLSWLDDKKVIWENFDY